MKVLQLASLFLLFTLSVPVTQGCVMTDLTDSTHTRLITQIILKPAATVPLDAQQQLSPAYIQQLQAGVTLATLSYLRPMSLGAHVLGLNPPLSTEDATTLTAALTERADVEYAEPDTVRQLY